MGIRPSKERTFQEPFALLRATVLTALVAHRHSTSKLRQTAISTGTPWSPPDHIWEATKCYEAIRFNLQNAIREEHSRIKGLIMASRARGQPPGNTLENWKHTWLTPGFCNISHGNVTQTLLPARPPGQSKKFPWGAARADWAPPPEPDQSTIRITIGTTPYNQTLGQAAWGAVVTRGGITDSLAANHSPHDIEGQHALGHIIAEAGEKGGTDNPTAALVAALRVLKGLEDDTMAPGVHKGNILICLPTRPLHLLSGTTFPTQAEANILAKNRNAWSQLITTALTATPPRHVWVAGPDRGPRGVRARALARQGAVSPIGNVIDTTMPPRIPDPWQQEEDTCYICWDKFSDMLPDPNSASSRATPFDCHIGKRHGLCWTCCEQLRAAPPPTAKACGICRCKLDPKDIPLT